MFQLLLPGFRSKTAGGGRGSSKKGRFFVGKEYVPCIYCGQQLTFKEATVEHIIPQWQGGCEAMENLTISCQPCNNHRQHHSFEDWKNIAPYDKLVRLLIKRNKIIGRCLI